MVKKKGLDAEKINQKFLWEVFKALSQALKNAKQARARRRHPEVFYKEAVHINIAKSTEKYLCQNLFFNKVAGLSLLLY